MASDRSFVRRAFEGLFIGFTLFLLLGWSVEVLSASLILGTFMILDPERFSLTSKWTTGELEVYLACDFRRWAALLETAIFVILLAELCYSLCTRKTPFTGFQRFLRSTTSACPDNTGRKIVLHRRSEGSQTEPQPPIISAEMIAEAEQKLAMKDQELDQLKQHATVMEQHLIAKSRELEHSKEDHAITKTEITAATEAAKNLENEMSELRRREVETGRLSERRKEQRDKLLEEKRLWQVEANERLHIHAKLQQSFSSMEKRVSSLTAESERLKKVALHRDAHEKNLIAQLSSQKEEDRSKQANMQKEQDFLAAVITTRNKQLSELQEEFLIKHNAQEGELTELRKQLYFTQDSQKNLIAQLSLQKQEFDSEGIAVNRELRERLTESQSLVKTLSSQNDESSRQVLDLNERVKELTQSLDSKADELDKFEQQSRRLRNLEVPPMALQLLETPVVVVEDEVTAMKLPADPLKEWTAHDKMFLTARIRPLSAEERSKNMAHCVVKDPNNSNTIILSDSKLLCTIPDMQRRSGSASFRFDKVFWAEADNPDIFEAFSYLVAGFVQGYSVGIISDGPSGSGKTHTMLKGPRGLIATAIHSILSHGLPENQVLSVRAVEVYNEQLRDVADEVRRSQDDPSTQLIPPSNKPVVVQPGTPPKHRFQMAAKSIAASWKSCSALNIDASTTYENIVKMCSDFDRKRITRDTAMNNTAHTPGSTATAGRRRQGGSSSRGHLVVIVSVGDGAAEDGTGRLTFVDLAGSELADENGLDAAREYEDIRKDRADCYHLLAVHRNRKGKQQYTAQRLFGHLIKTLFEGGGKELKLAHIFHFTPLSFELNHHLMAQVKLLSKVDMTRLAEDQPQSRC